MPPDALQVDGGIAGGQGMAGHGMAGHGKAELGDVCVQCRCLSIILETSSVRVKSNCF